MFFCEYRKTGEGRGFPCRFYKSLKVPWFWKKRPDSANLWVKISIQNVVLRVSRRKNSKTFPCDPFFSMFLTKCLLKCPNFSQKLLCPEKFLIARLPLVASIPKRNSPFDKRLSFDKCSFPIDFAFSMSIWCSERTTQPETILFSVDFLVVRVYRYFLFVYMQKI